MKCQSCNDPATHHITEIVGGDWVEHHVCDNHVQELDALKGTKATGGYEPGPEFLQAHSDPVARQKLAAHLLPALCLALRDDLATVRALAAFWLGSLGGDAASAAGALREAQDDPDTQVRKAAEYALRMIRGVRVEE